MRSLLALIVLAAAIAPATAQRAHERPAQKHLDAALALYARSEFDAASVEFEHAYEIDADPALLYALAQANRLGGHCDVAMSNYGRYLDTHPNATQVAAARTGMQLCEDEQHRLEEQAAWDQAAKDRAARLEASRLEAASHRAVEPPISGRSDDLSGRPRAWYRSPVGGALAAGGLLGVGVGVGYLVASSSAQRRADAAPTRDEFIDAVDDTNRRRRIGFGALAAGAGLVTAAVLVYVLDRPHAPAMVRAGADPTGVYLSVETAF